MPILIESTNLATLSEQLKCWHTDHTTGSRCGLGVQWLTCAVLILLVQLRFCQCGESIAGLETGSSYVLCKSIHFCKQRSITPRCNVPL